MKHLILNASAAVCFALGGTYALSTPAHASETTALSAKAKMLLGDWEQGADRIVGEGEEAARVTAATETYRADGTGDVNYRIVLLGESLPVDLRTYDFQQVNAWRLEGDKLYSKALTVKVIYSGENPLGNKIATAIQADAMKEPEDFSTLVSINANNYISRMSDGTLISMKRK